MTETVSQPVIVVEDDPFLRVVQVVLDPATPAQRVAAFDHFFASDLDDFSAWCTGLRAGMTRLHPSRIRLVRSQSEMRHELPGAHIVVVESLTVGAAQIEAAGPTLALVQKYGTLTRNIDQTACAAHGIGVLTLRRHANT